MKGLLLMISLNNISGLSNIYSSSRVDSYQNKNYNSNSVTTPKALTTDRFEKSSISFGGKMTSEGKFIRLLTEEEDADHQIIVSKLAYEGVNEPEYANMEETYDPEDENNVINSYYDENGVLRKKTLKDCGKVLDEAYFYDENGNEILNVDVYYSVGFPYRISVDRLGDGINFPKEKYYYISTSEKKLYDITD